MPILEVNNLRKIYTTRLGANRVEALKNVSFSVEKANMSPLWAIRFGQNHPT